MLAQYHELLFEKLGPAKAVVYNAKKALHDCVLSYRGLLEERARLKHDVEAYISQMQQAAEYRTVIPYEEKGYLNQFAGYGVGD